MQQYWNWGHNLLPTVLKYLTNCDHNGAQRPETQKTKHKDPSNVDGLV